MNRGIKVMLTSDYKAVVAVVQKYVDALRLGSVELMAQTLCKEAIGYGFIDSELQGGALDSFFDFVHKVGQVPEIKTHLDVLAVTPTTAVVRVDIEQYALGANYNDYLTLVKVDDNWKVIAMVFHQFG